MQKALIPESEIGILIPWKRGGRVFNVNFTLEYNTYKNGHRSQVNFHEVSLSRIGETSSSTPRNSSICRRSPHPGDSEW